MSEYEDLKLIDAEGAISMMQGFVDAGEEWVSVFVDRGWGQNPLEITIITDGNGQKPHARLTKETKDELLRMRRIRPNSLRTYKARKIHDFVPAAGQETQG